MYILCDMAQIGGIIMFKHVDRNMKVFKNGKITDRKQGSGKNSKTLGRTL